MKSALNFAQYLNRLQQRFLAKRYQKMNIKAIMPPFGCMPINMDTPWPT